MSNTTKVSTEDIKNYEKHYSDQSFIQKVSNSAKKAGIKVIYSALLLYYGLKSPRTTLLDKALIIGALGYFISPLDLIPDCIPVIGYADDVGVLALALSKIGSRIGEEEKNLAKNKLYEWFGNYDNSKIEEIDSKIK